MTCSYYLGPYNHLSVAKLNDNRNIGAENCKYDKTIVPVMNLYVILLPLRVANGNDLAPLCGVLYLILFIESVDKHYLTLFFGQSDKRIKIKIQGASYPVI